MSISIKFIRMTFAYLIKYLKLNMKQLDHRRRLIDSFVNAIYLFDDYLVITFNYKEGTKRVTFAEIEEAFGSDLSSLTAQQKEIARAVSFCFTGKRYAEDSASCRAVEWGKGAFFICTVRSVQTISTCLDEQCAILTKRQHKKCIC